MNEEQREINERLANMSQEELGYVYRQTTGTPSPAAAARVLGEYGYQFLYMGEGEHYQIKRGDTLIADVQSFADFEQALDSLLEQERKRELDTHPPFAFEPIPPVQQQEERLERIEWWKSHPPKWPVEPM